MRIVKMKIGLCMGFLGIIIFNLTACQNEESSNGSQEIPDQELEIKKSYYPSGNIKVEQQFLKDSIKHGLKKAYFETGELHSTITYHQNEKHGIATWYYPNGNIKGIFNYEDGEIIGKARDFDSTGKLYSEITFRDNKKHGPAIYYNDQGNPEVLTYRNKKGLIIYRVDYNEQGEVIEEGGLGIPEIIVNTEFNADLQKVYMDKRDTLIAEVNYVDPPHADPTLTMYELTEDSMIIEKKTFPLTSNNDQVILKKWWESTGVKRLKFVLKMNTTDPKAKKEYTIEIKVKVR